MRLFWILALACIGYAYTQNESFPFFQYLFPKDQSYCDAFVSTQSQQTLLEGLHKYYPEATFLESKQEFIPYLEIRVKHVKDPFLSEESTLIWSLRDGEMILNTKTWQKTHGLGDCIRSKASREELTLMRMIMQEGGVITVPQLNCLNQKKGIEQQGPSILARCLSKGLLARQGIRIKVHFQRPIWPVNPYTEQSRMITWKPFMYYLMIKPEFSSGEILSFVERLFETKQINIQSYHVIFLPIHLVLFKLKGEINSLYLNGITGGLYRLN